MRRPRARRIKAAFEVAALDAFGDFTAAELSAMGLLLDYIELTQAGAAPRLAPPRRNAERAFMAIDAATRAALEIERSVRGGARRLAAGVRRPHRHARRAGACWPSASRGR